VGGREAWQQSRQVLHRWTQILSAAYALPQPLATYCGEQMEELMRLTPWRKKATVTAGQVRLGLRLFFWQCPGSGLVEPDMPEISSVRFSPSGDFFFAPPPLFSVNFHRYFSRIVSIFLAFKILYFFIAAS
jgi:hypothetical protein